MQNFRLLKKPLVQKFGFSSTLLVLNNIILCDLTHQVSYVLTFMDYAYENIEKPPQLLTIMFLVVFYSSVRAPDLIPAAKPDCNRYVEALVQRLCMTMKTPKKNVGTRWSCIMDAYDRIQATILSNATVMAETSIQLPYLSH